MPCGLHFDSALWPALAWLLAGCGRIGFAPVDACELGTFSAPRRLVELSSPAGDNRPVLSPDRLTIWFDSTRDGLDHLMRAVRPAIDAPFGAPEAVPIELAGGTGDPFVSDDGLTLWFSNTPSDADHADLYVATRPSTTADFTNPQPVTELNSTLADFAPTTTSDELTLVFNSYRGIDDDLYISTRASKAAQWSAPQRLDGVRSDKLECCGSLSATGDRLLFASTVLDPGTTEALFEATRSGTDFINPTPIAATAVGGNGGDTHPNLSRDGKTIVFASDRSGGAGGFDLYEVDRECVAR